MEEYDRVLGRLYEAFEGDSEESGIEARFHKKAEEPGLEEDIVITLHHSFGTVGNLAEGRFYFYGDIFMSKVVLAVDVPGENLLKLCVLISLANARLPAGCFEYDIYEKALVYSLKTPIAEGLSEEELYELADRCAAIALSVSEQNSQDLIECALASRGI